MEDNIPDYDINSTEEQFEIIKKHKPIFNEEAMNLLINNNQEYTLNLIDLLSTVYLNKNISSKKSENEYLLNLLLMSSKLDKSNKLVCLSLLLYLNQYNKSNYICTYSILSKIEKITKTLKKPQNLEDFLYLTNSSFLENKNFLFLARNYLTNIKEKLINQKSDKYMLIDILLKEIINKNVQIYLDSCKNQFINKEIMSDSHLDNLKKTINLINDKKNVINSQFFLINKNWIIKAKSFIDSFVGIRKENLENIFMENCFNMEMVYDYFMVKFNNETPKNTLGVIFPGQINNHEIMDLNDSWFDPEKSEENIIIKNNLQLNRDYFSISEEDWLFLKNIFQATNEIKRDKNDECFFRIKTFILEPSLSSKENRHLLKIKNIQIDVDSTIKEFKNKIIRCLDYAINKNQNNINKEENDLIFYLMNKENKDILIEITLSYVNNNEAYQSIFIQQIKFQDEELIKDTFNYIDKKKYILIVEIIQKNKLSFIRPLIKEDNSNIFNCSICNQQINLGENFNCYLCNMSLYCSKECAEVPDGHYKLHELLNDFYIKKFEFEKFLKSSDNQMPKDIQRKIMGLEKDKKYSHINSVIQCLSSNDYLLRYFFYDFYKSDINIINHLKANTNSLAVKYSELIKEMWSANANNKKLDTIYNDFVAKIEKGLKENATKVFGNDFIDDTLKFLLNNLDLELKRSTNNDKTKENSIITDLYQGIYEFGIYCPNCGNVAMAFENLNALLLPIPKKNHTILKIKYFNDFECKYMKFIMDENSTIRDLKDKAIQNIDDKIKHLMSIMSLSNLIDVTPFDTDEEDKILSYTSIYNSIELIQFDKNKLITKIYRTRIYNDTKKDSNESNNNNNNNTENNNNTNNDNNTIKANNELNLQLNKIYKENDVELVFYERSFIDKKCKNIYIYPYLYNEKEKTKKNIERLFNVYPIAISAKTDLILENFEYLVNVKLRDLLIDHFREESEKRNINYIELVIPHYFHDSPYYSQAICPFCKEKRKGASLFCKLFSAIDKEKTVYDLFKLFKKINQPIFLLAKCKYYEVKNKIYANISSFPIDKANKKQEDKLDIYDCFELYARKENINQSWTCTSCKTNPIPYKHSFIHKPPLYLIIQINRLVMKTSTFRSSISIANDDTLIYYPIDNLDIKDFIQSSEKCKTTYNLYGVIYKESSFRSENIYSICQMNDKWMMIKDNKISQINPNSIINKNAHFLFYKRSDL
jgi:ubiquitin C-terminal hydrolase